MVLHREHRGGALGRGPTTPAWIVGVVVAALIGAVAIGVAVNLREETASPAAEPALLIPTQVPERAYDPGSRAEALNGHVLLEFTGPAAKGFETYPGSGWTASELSGTFGVALDALYGAGLIDAYGTAWFNDWGTEHGQDLVSVTMIFDTETGAETVFGLMRANDDIAGMDALPKPKLGENSYAWQDDYEGLPTIAYVWYFGDEVSILASQGSDDSPALTPSVMHPLAERVQGQIAWDL